MNDENIWRSKISLNCPFNLSYVLVVFVALVGAWFMMVNVVVIVIVVNVVEAVVTHWSLVTPKKRFHHLLQDLLRKITKCWHLFFLHL